MPSIIIPRYSASPVSKPNTSNLFHMQSRMAPLKANSHPKVF
ncbi:hypothetical protein DDB_G0269516 [Dictyostelium discoideum AX4]|uniref:Uncharacterized protein n=1 Tax=Dictyostelium discoideum TaxID=44689 RepID=Q55DV3_DICDI|nr:hypothetical protein DDB_G0269516 [Dictyostelium discoideum AX4]EAL72108.1 hypothetical protein DDB_G0269516 [Dictyostelium discoideum AX4]|eukprot:XP_646028.1 hypothetical protein DDB_G0269516 [Dictyostelium discoideum AX4]